MRDRLVALLTLLTFSHVIQSCGPSGAQHSVRRRNPAKRIAPFVRYQRSPNVAELTLGASGPTEKVIVKGSRRFKQLVVYGDNNVVFKKWKRKQMSKRCKDKLSALSIMVLNEWQGVKLRVIEGYANKKNLKLHSTNSLHYEGRALDITTDDRDLNKYGRLARLAEDAGFDWVFYQSKRHIHVSVKSDEAVTTQAHGCFAADSRVQMRDGSSKPVQKLAIGDLVLTGDGSQFTEVIGWLHYDPAARSRFVRLTFSDNTSIALTESHLLFSSGESVFAGGVQVTRTIDSTARWRRLRVRRRQLVAGVGVFAPLTRQGTISVNGVACSCYAVVRSHRIAHHVMAPVRLWYALRAALPSWSYLVGHSDPVPYYGAILFKLTRPFLPAYLLLR